MNITEIIIGHRVLAQTSESQKEIARVKTILDNGKVVLALTNGLLCVIKPQYLIKTFGFA